MKIKHTGKHNKNINKINTGKQNKNINKINTGKQNKNINKINGYLLVSRCSVISIYFL